MAQYGNILTIFQCSAQQVQAVEAIFTARGTDYEKVENAYFIETNSKVNTGEVVTDLKALQIQFVLFHNHDHSGSRIEAKGIIPETITHIKQILFE